MEGTAAFGLILVAAGLLGPFTNLDNITLLRIFKWIYSAGALIFTLARIAGSTDPSESLRLRRLRRLEFWAGVAFCIGAFFWFYNEDHYAFTLNLGVGAFACIQETVYFTLAGGVIQIVAAVALTMRMNKEQKQDL